MKDVMATITTQTLALRISKTNVKQWTLYGPIDQALKTSVQAKAVKAHELCPTLNGTQVPLALWVSADPVYSDNDEPPNLLAMTMLAIQRLRARGEEPHVSTSMTGALMIDMGVIQAEVKEPIFGPAILTGAGGESLPEVETPCIFHALLGQDH